MKRSVCITTSVLPRYCAGASDNISCAKQSAATEPDLLAARGIFRSFIGEVSY